MHAIPRWAMLPILALVLALSGCATANMSLSPEELQTIRIERVDVVYQPDTMIQWEKVEVPYVERVKSTKTASGKAKPWKQVMQDDVEAAKNEYQTIVNSQEGKKYIQGVLTAELKKRVGTAIVPKFQGTRPVVLEITVVAFSIPGPLQRAVIGGTPALGAITVLKDSATGKELAKLDQMSAGIANSGVIGVLVDQAFEDLEDRVFNAYIGNLSSWLRTKRES